MTTPTFNNSYFITNRNDPTTIWVDSSSVVVPGPLVVLHLEHSLRSKHGPLLSHHVDHCGIVLPKSGHAYYSGS